MMYKKLNELLQYEQPTKYLVKTTNYSEEYKIPVLTAGQSFILGYTNEEENVFLNENLPVIIFDDFTTSSKFVDFQFKVKSSAMKILRLIGNDNIKYIYYAMQNINFDNSIHKRYWISEYGNIKIKIPSLEEQNNIVKELDLIEEMIEEYEKEIWLLDELIATRFIEEFGTIDKPKFNKMKLKEISKIITGNTPSRKIKEYYGNDIEWIKSDNINNNNLYLTKAVEGLSNLGKSEGRVAPINSILVTCIAGSLACIGNAGINNREVCFNQQINAIVPNQNLNYLFMYIQIINNKKYIQSFVNESMKGILSKGKMEEIEFIVPPIEKQNDFAKIVNHIETMKEDYRKTINQTLELKSKLMNKYFN